MWIVLLLLAAPLSHAQILSDDLNCTTQGSDGTYVYTFQATMCTNSFPDDECKSLFGDGTNPGAVAGTDNPRPPKCYKSGDTISPEAKKNAIEHCASYCGYCCETSAFDCQPNPVPPTDCSKLSKSDCSDPNTKSAIITSCPGFCGFCDVTGCVDNDHDFCQEQGTAICLTDPTFANTNCRRMCGICKPYESTPTCSDTSPNCAEWEQTGFCENDFWTAETKQQYCAKTCHYCT